jgi:hypothetical protein
VFELKDSKGNCFTLSDCGPSQPYKSLDGFGSPHYIKHVLRHCDKLALVRAYRYFLSSHKLAGQKAPLQNSSSRRPDLRASAHRPAPEEQLCLAIAEGALRLVQTLKVYTFDITRAEQAMGLSRSRLLAQLNVIALEEQRYLQNQPTHNPLTQYQTTAPDTSSGKISRGSQRQARQTRSSRKSNYATQWGAATAVTGAEFDLATKSSSATAIAPAKALTIIQHYRRFLAGMPQVYKTSETFSISGLTHQNPAQTQSQDIIKALGFASHKVSVARYEQALDRLNTVWCDPSLFNVLQRFAKNYLQANNPAGQAVKGATLFELALTLLLCHNHQPNCLSSANARQIRLFPRFKDAGRSLWEMAETSKAISAEKRNSAGKSHKASFSDLAINPAPPRQPNTPPKKQTETTPENYVLASYFYADGSGVAAQYTVCHKASGAVLAEGTLPSSGEAKVPLPLDVDQVTVKFHSDPAPITQLKESQPQLQATPPGWFDRMKTGVSTSWANTRSGVNWAWGVVQGDFNENPSAAQIITNAVITMVPVVDQVADARDIVANLKLLVWDKKYNEVAVWFAFFITLIGLIPIAGSALKGVLKLVWRGAKLDEILKVFNYFMKGNGVSWLKQLKGGQLHNYAKEAAQTAHSVMATVTDKVVDLKALIPKSITRVHQQLQDILGTLENVKGQINQRFDELATQLCDKIDIALKQAGEKTGLPASAKGSASKTQEAMPPPKDGVIEIDFGISVSQDRQLITELVNRGNILKARELLNPYVQAAKVAKTPAAKRNALNDLIDRLDVSSNKEKVFWSGNKVEAAKYAEKNGKTILEQTVGGRVMDDWEELNNTYTWDNNDMPPHGWDLWGDISEKYAHDASGNIQVVQTAVKFPRGGPTWQGREWPSLYRNKEVGEITIFKIDDSGSIIDQLSVDSKSDLAIELFGSPY